MRILYILYVFKGRKNFFEKMSKKVLTKLECRNIIIKLSAREHRKSSIKKGKKVLTRERECGKIKFLPHLKDGSKDLEN